MCDDTTNESTNEIPYGYCACGCGQKTTIVAFNNPQKGLTKGQPRTYVLGHHTRVIKPKIDESEEGPNPSGLCMCGCGQPAPIAERTNRTLGFIRGKPKRHIAGHQTTGPKPTAASERFLAKVDKDGPIHAVLKTQCWVYTAGLTNAGYGRFFDGEIDTMAHRYSYRFHYGEIPDNLWVLHRCDNPACVRPDHLFLGTQQDNVDDMIAKNRHRQGHCPAGESNPSVKLTEAEVLEIRAIAKAGTRRKLIAQQFGVSLPLIEKIISRSVWKHI